MKIRSVLGALSPKSCIQLAMLLLLVPLLLMAQSDRGSISGTVTDPAGASVPSAKVIATLTATGMVFETVTTSTGNYTLPSLPVGTYSVTVEAAGFTRYVQQGITVATVQVARVDVSLKIGSTSESVTVTSDAPLLRTENAEQSHTVSGDQIDKLPLTYAGNGLRNPTAMASMQAGANVTYDPGANFSVRVNGVPNGTFRALMDGQDITSGIDATHLSEGHPSTESLQQVTLETSNFAAEFGQVAGGLFNFTSRSGTNQLHGTAYEYLVNEKFDAGQAFTSDGHGNLVRPIDRNNNYGFAVGGPVWIPKIYNGKDKTFFFFNFEQFRNKTGIAGTFGTVPTAAYRNGDFSGALTGRTLGTDDLGRPILEDEIYDPTSNFTLNGKILRNPFSGNKLPTAMMDPVALKLQSYLPNSTNGNTINNFLQNETIPKVNSIPSIKVDHSLFNAKMKVSFYWSEFRNDVSKSNGDGLPYPVSAGRFFKTRTNTYRLSVDHTISPTLLLHVGLGEMNYNHYDSAPLDSLSFDAVGKLGLVGAARTPGGFPQINIDGSTQGGFSATGMGATTTGSFGPGNANQYLNDNPTVIVSATWIRSNHTIKFGAEGRRNIWSDLNYNGTMGSYNFRAQETGIPGLQSNMLNGGIVGFPYASFLLGMPDAANVNSGQTPQLRKKAYGLYVQDTWKVTRKLTVDYGIRYDYQTGLSELHHRLSVFGPGIANPSAGGLLGGVAYEGSGAGTCNCSFMHTYKYGFGPRLGVAYQMDSKTVIRGGWGLIYGATPGVQYMSGSPMLGTGWGSVSRNASTYGVAPFTLAQGFRYPDSELHNNSHDPGIRPDPGQIDPPSFNIDANAGRPPRISQWNISVQRQITPNFSVEAAYVGNRGVWLQADQMTDINGLSGARIAAAGLSLNSAADRALLTSPMNSSQVIAKGFKAPYAAFPMTLTLAQALRPYPQFSNIDSKWVPRGNTWYDALQTKVTKRLAKGLEASGSFTWQKELALGAMEGVGWLPVATNDVYNRGVNKFISSESQPHVLTATFSYNTPAVTSNKLVRTLVRDWTVGGAMRYASGLPIEVPFAQTSINTLLLRDVGWQGTGTFDFRVPGQPLFLNSLNGSSDPNRQLYLNPKAWSEPAQGQFGGQAFYSDYRYQRRPTESLSIGRMFTIREGMSFEVRFEAFNAFNRTEKNDPDGTNSLTTATFDKSGNVQSGFGRVNTGGLFAPPRHAQMLARFRF